MQVGSGARMAQHPLTQAVRTTWTRLTSPWNRPTPSQKMRYGNLKWHVEKARIALKEGDFRGMTEAANKMERFRYYKEAWRTFHQIDTLQHPVPGRPWRGPRDQTETLFVKRRLRDLGDELRQVRLCARAAQDVPNVIVLTEARLVPLFQRSFPSVHFISDPDSVQPDLQTATTTYEQLAFFYASDEASIMASYQPLTPPPASEAIPKGLGIAWFSSAIYKNLPSVADWAALLSTVDGRVQSLQYREGQAGLDDLVRLSGRPVKAARAVDQFKDLDGYAAQVASVRRVLTISNTTAHMAGALGIPCVVVLDDDHVTTWPDHGDQSPFYPNLRLIRRQGEDWVPTLKNGLALLKSLPQRCTTPSITRS